MAIAAAIPIVEKWVSEFTLKWHEWKVKQNDAKYLEAFEKSRKGNTTGLQSELGKLSDNSEEVQDR